MMPNERMRVNPVMAELLLYGKRLLGMKANNHLCWQVEIFFSVTRSGISYVSPNNRACSIKPVAGVARREALLFFFHCAP